MVHYTLQTYQLNLLKLTDKTIQLFNKTLAYFHRRCNLQALKNGAILTKDRIILTVSGLILFSYGFRSQDSLKGQFNYKVKPAFLNTMLTHTENRLPGSRSYLIDSLSIENLLLKEQNDSLLLLINNEIGRSQEIEQETAKLKETSENLNKELELTRGSQLQTSHTSSILLIFNVLAGIILLVALVWIFYRKKTDHATAGQTAETINKPRIITDHLDKKMERIEKLGKLRDKGLLTEEEFQFQKKQILS